MNAANDSATLAGPPRGAKEITVRAVVLGILIGCVMAIANVYLGLFAGMTVSASIPAAVISMGVLRGLMRTGSILENNIVQTIASAGESLAAGIIFTMPALVITGVWTEFDFWTTTLVSVTGGMLGVLFMIPLRRPMIVEDKELLYPEGIACAKVLEAGETGDKSTGGVGLIFGGLAVAMAIKFAIDKFKLIGAELVHKFAIGKAGFMVSVLASPALIGVGFIVGLNIAALVFIGGAISWVFAGPYLSSIDYQGIATAAAATAAAGDTSYAAEIADAVKPHLRFLGVGAMIVGGLWSILMIRNGIARGIQETIGGYRASIKGAERRPESDTDMEPKWILFLLAATSLIVAILYEKVTGSVGVSALATVLMIVCSFFFVAVAAYIVGLVGSSNSPVSGMTICSVLFTSAFIALFGFEGNVAILATMGVAGVVCCATCTSGDVCQDLKTGSLVGATPWRQQWMEVVGVVTSSFVMCYALNLLHHSRGIGIESHLPPEVQATSEPLAAPQAQLFASLMNGFFGDEPLPWGLIGTGALIGALIIVIDQLVLAPRRSRFRMHVMPVAVGMYLSFHLSSAILVGGLIAWIAQRGFSSEDAREKAIGRGTILASGLIAGESMGGVLDAATFTWEVDPLLESPLALNAMALAVIVGMSTWLIRTARASNA